MPGGSNWKTNIQKQVNIKPDDATDPVGVQFLKELSSEVAISNLVVFHEREYHKDREQGDYTEKWWVESKMEEPKKK
jgi:hypothetical protein